jgi:hypothetical protein
MQIAHAAPLGPRKPAECTWARIFWNGEKLIDSGRLIAVEDAMNGPLHEIERMLEAQGREMLRAMMQEQAPARVLERHVVALPTLGGV